MKTKLNADAVCEIAENNNDDINGVTRTHDEMKTEIDVTTNNTRLIYGKNEAQLKFDIENMNQTDEYKNNIKRHLIDAEIERNFFYSTESHKKYGDSPLSNNIATHKLLDASFNRTTATTDITEKYRHMPGVLNNSDILIDIWGGICDLANHSNIKDDLYDACKSLSSIYSGSTKNKPSTYSGVSELQNDYGSDNIPLLYKPYHANNSTDIEPPTQDLYERSEPDLQISVDLFDDVEMMTEIYKNPGLSTRNFTKADLASPAKSDKKIQVMLVCVDDRSLQENTGKIRYLTLDRGLNSTAITITNAGLTETGERRSEALNAVKHLLQQSENIRNSLLSDRLFSDSILHDLHIGAFKPRFPEFLIDDDDFSNIGGRLHNHCRNRFDPGLRPNALEWNGKKIVSKYHNGQYPSQQSQPKKKNNKHGKFVITQPSASTRNNYNNRNKVVFNNQNVHKPKRTKK